jgi:hypothetical protein
MADKDKDKKKKSDEEKKKTMAKARSARAVRRPPQVSRAAVQASANKEQVSQKMAEMRRAPQPVSEKMKADRQRQMAEKASEVKRASQARIIPPRPEQPPERRSVVPPQAKAELQRSMDQKMQYNK